MKKLATESSRKIVYFSRGMNTFIGNPIKIKKKLLQSNLLYETSSYTKP